MSKGKDRQQVPRPQPSIPEDELPPVEFYFDARDSAYWFSLNGHFCAFKKSDLKMHLQTLGYSDFPSKKIPGIAVIDVPFHDAITKRMIHFAGPLSGHRVGPFVDGSNRRCLVTEEPNPIVFAKLPREARKPKRIFAFMEKLLPGDQFYLMLYWLKFGFESLRKGDFRSGQMVCLVGEGGCGKSLMQDIITEVYGGRAADPYRYMNGLTQFNKDIASAEHWKMSDPPSTTDMRTRLKFGDYIKDATVNSMFGVHGKGKDALCLMPVFHRVTLAVNDEGECIAIIPPMIPSIALRIFLFKCEMSDVGDDRQKTWAWVKEEIPLLHAYLANMPAPPKEWRDNRFGIKSWQHPELYEALNDMSAEYRLLQIIDQVFFSGAEATWDTTLATTGIKAIELEQRLRKSEYGFSCEKLLSYSGACGSHLGKLSKTMPERVQRRTRDGVNFWRILPPQPTEENEESAK